MWRRADLVARTLAEPALKPSPWPVMRVGRVEPVPVELVLADQVCFETVPVLAGADSMGAEMMGAGTKQGGVYVSQPWLTTFNPVLDREGLPAGVGVMPKSWRATT